MNLFLRPIHDGNPYLSLTSPDHAKTPPAVVNRFACALFSVPLLALWAVSDPYMSLGGRALDLPVGAAAIGAAAALTTEPLIFAAIMVATLLWRVPTAPLEGQHS